MKEKTGTKKAPGNYRIIRVYAESPAGTKKVLIWIILEFTARQQCHLNKMDISMPRTSYVSICFVFSFFLLITLTPSLALENESVVENGAEFVMVADGLKFSEGPAVYSSGTVWFSDYGTDKIYRIIGGSAETVLENVGGPIGLHFDNEGSLYICAAKEHRIKKLPADVIASSSGPYSKEQLVVYSDRFDGKLLNSPNDIWVDKKGGVYFTDPRFAPLPEEVEQDGYHIYYIPAGSTKIIRAAVDLDKPNGIVGTHDGRLVYVTDTPVDKTFVYDVGNHGRLSGKRFFAEGGYDGMAVDVEGNVYITLEHSIEVYNSSGEKIEALDVPGKPTNVCFGGDDRKTLYITARSKVFSLRMRIRGM